MAAPKTKTTLKHYDIDGVEVRRVMIVVGGKRRMRWQRLDGTPAVRVSTR